MAAFLLCHKTVYKDQNLPIQNITRQNDKRPMHDFSDLQRSFFSKSNVGEEISPRCLGHAGCFLRNTTTRGTFLHRFYSPAYNLRFIQGCCYSDKDRFSTVSCSSESGTNEKHLRALDAYFGKLQDNVKAKVLSPLDSSPQVMQECHKEGEAVSKKGLESLDAYLAKLNNDTNLDSLGPSTYNEHYNEDIIRKETERDYYRKQNTYVSIRRTKGERGLTSSGDTIQQDEASSLYLVGILASINIAVFLFEIASPIRNSDLELFSLPLLYGAKINQLIVLGEWWRLVTPMFLHSGIFDMALSCWALVSFGPQVCRGYGSFTFLLIYILGGVSGNLTSFLHTPDPTVGGTGPIFGIIGAWLAYQIQNKDIDANDTSDIMFHKAFIITALCFILSHFCPMDDWAHCGAAFTGMAFGFFTSPTLQLKDASSSSSSSGGSGQEEGLKLVRQYGDSCRSLLVFTIFILVLSSFLFFMEPPLYALASVLAFLGDNLVLYI